MYCFGNQRLEKKSGQYGSCYLFGRNPDSRQKEITNGGCDSSGNTKCYGKIDEKGCIKILMYKNTYIHIFRGKIGYKYTLN